MKPQLLLRIAAVLTLIHAVLHTVGGLLGEPSHGPEERAVIAAMKASVFDFMGSPRTYWDFYFGFGLFLSVGLVLQAVLLWQLAALAKSDPAKARPFMISLFLAFVAAILALVAWSAITLYLVVGVTFRNSLLGYFTSCLAAVNCRRD